MTITRMELWRDEFGSDLEIWYDTDTWPRTIESKDREWLEDVAAALADRHGLVRVGDKWRRP